MKKIKLKISKKMKQFNMFLKISGEDHIRILRSMFILYNIIIYTIYNFTNNTNTIHKHSTANTI